MAKIAIAIGFGVLGAFTGGLGWAAGIGLQAGAQSALIGFSFGLAVGGPTDGLPECKDVDAFVQRFNENPN